MLSNIVIDLPAGRSQDKQLPYTDQLQSAFTPLPKANRRGHNAHIKSAQLITSVNLPKVQLSAALAHRNRRCTYRDAHFHLRKNAQGGLNF